MQLSNCVALYMATLFSLCEIASAASSQYFGLHFVDAQTGRGVPLVQVQLTSELRFYSDSNGYVAFDEPGLMNHKVWFGVKSYGYQAKAVALGYRGLTALTKPGRILEVKLKRTNIAQRLYRLTGEGIYRDTVLLRKRSPISDPLLDGNVMGQDTVETAVYKGKMIWCWGDTDRVSFPLGNFDTSGATSPPPAQINLEKGINYTYFTGKDGFCRGMIKLNNAPSGPVWIDSLMNVPDASGQQKLLGRYVVTKNMRVTERGLLLFNDATQTFDQLKRIPMDAPVEPGGHPMRAMVNGREYYYFPVPYPIVRVQADFAHASDPSAYEGFTCLQPGTVFSRHNPPLNRDGSGKLRWTWQRGAKPVGPKEASELVSSGAIKQDESPYRMRNVANGKSLYVANGSVAWDNWAHKWVMVFGQLGGKSNLGEIFVAFAHSPEGPWTAARKIATHAMEKNNNDFYNPMLHGEFMQDNGQIVYFEGTLVITFSGNAFPTPRYNYNQIMYRVDLSDPRIDLPDPPPGLSNALPSCLGT